MLNPYLSVTSFTRGISFALLLLFFLYLLPHHLAISVSVLSNKTFIKFFAVVLQSTLNLAHSAWPPPQTGGCFGATHSLTYIPIYIWYYIYQGKITKDSGQKISISDDAGQKTWGGPNGVCWVCVWHMAVTFRAVSAYLWLWNLI